MGSLPAMSTSGTGESGTSSRPATARSWSRRRAFLAVCRYVVLNPVRAGISAQPDDYHWSSYRETSGLISRGALLCSDSLLSRFAPSRARAEAGYREFVSLGSPNLNDEVRGERLGSDELLKRDFNLPTPLEEI